MKFSVRTFPSFATAVVLRRTLLTAAVVAMQIVVSTTPIAAIALVGCTWSARSFLLRFVGHCMNQVFVLCSHHTTVAAAVVTQSLDSCHVRRKRLDLSSLDPRCFMYSRSNFDRLGTKSRAETENY